MRSLYTEPLVYQMLHGSRAEDLPFYLDLASKRAPAGSGRAILDLRIGTGRVAIALARAGHRVRGVDLDPSMLQTLAERLRLEPQEVLERVDFERADARVMSLGERFPLVLAPFSLLCHLRTRSDLAGFLRVAREHLDDDGVFALDVGIPDLALLKGRVADSPRFRHPRTGEVCRSTERCTYDAIAQVMSVELEITSIESPETPELLVLRLRQLFPEELMILLEQAGFLVAHRTSRFALWESDARPLEGELDVERGDSIAYVCTAPRR
jgi:SAM-dependent methyltransferase